MIQDTVNRLQFRLRHHWLGKIRLRSGLPTLSQSEMIQKERRFYTLILSRLFQGEILELVDQVIDVGCRNWSYARALADFFPRANLVGIELDGRRRYWNLYRRMDFAQAYANELCRESRSAKFWLGDFEQFKNLPASKNTLFCFFYPFVSENPCLQWGLPIQYVKFSTLLKHTQALKQTNAWVMSSHQGEWEAENARIAYQESGISFKETVLSVKETSEVWPSLYDTHLLYSKLASQ